MNSPTPEKLDDGIEEVLCLLLRETEQGSIHTNVFPACQIMMETGPQLEQRGNPSVYLDATFVRVRKTRDHA